MKKEELNEGVVLPKKKTKNKDAAKSIMKAVTKAVTSIPSGPSKANLKKKPKTGRKDMSDGPSAEVKGKA